MATMMAAPDTAVLRDRLALACAWMTDSAQVKDPAEITDAHRARHAYTDWVGALKGEYRARDREWSFFCPVWHTGQAVKALVMAAPWVGEHVLDAARRGAEFILAQQISGGVDDGLILAYEDHPDRVNTSAILECLDGLVHLYEATGEHRYREAVVSALTWVADHAYLPGEGRFLDLYDPQACVFVPRGYLVAGRPLLDDGIFLKGYALSGEDRFRTIALEVADRLLRDEDPPGNWVMYPPCNLLQETIHPRQAYWWGAPMLTVFEQTGDKAYLDAFKRAVDWYRAAMRLDGGIFRRTRRDFATDSFGHATSAVACALAMFIDAATRVADAEIRPTLERALAFCLQMQFTHPADPNLAGAILEKVLPPDGSDASPYHIRDLGTIFFVQALSKYLEAFGTQ